MVMRAIGSECLRLKFVSRLVVGVEINICDFLSLFKEFFFYWFRERFKLSAMHPQTMSSTDVFNDTQHKTMKTPKILSNPTDNRQTTKTSNQEVTKESTAERINFVLCHTYQPLKM
jgi:hypothetical protein